jgi:hypothetical protein
MFTLSLAPPVVVQWVKLRFFFIWGYLGSNINLETSYPKWHFSYFCKVSHGKYRDSDQVTTASHQILSSSLSTKNTTNSTQGSTKVTWHWRQQTKSPMWILYNQWDATYTMFFTIISAVHVSSGFSAHHQELIKLYVQPWVLSCFPAVYCWCGWVGTVPTHPHQWQTVGKHDNNQGCAYSFISSWWWAEIPPETRRTLMIINNII